MKFEATPEYLNHPAVPERIQVHYPDVRIVIVLRQPVARAYSAWNMYRPWAGAGFIPLGMWQGRRTTPCTGCSSRGNRLHSNNMLSTKCT